MSSRAARFILAFALTANSAMAKPRPEEEFIPRRVFFQAKANNYQNLEKHLPCPSGHFKTTVTVFDPVEHAKYGSGAEIHLGSKDDRVGFVVSLQTLDRVLPLRGQVDTFEDHPHRKILAAQFQPSRPVVLEVTGANARNFTISFDGRDQISEVTEQPMFWFIIQGVGSRVVFDNNQLECDLIA